MSRKRGDDIDKCNDISSQIDLLLRSDRLSFCCMLRNALGLIENKGLIAAIKAAVTGIIDEYEVKPEHYPGDLDPERIVYKKMLSQ